MTTEQQYKESLRRWLEALNAQDWDAFDRLVDEVVAGDYVGHLPGTQALVRGPEGIKQYFRGVIKAFPAYHGTVEDVLVVGNKGASRFTARRTDPAERERRHWRAGASLTFSVCVTFPLVRVPRL